MEKKYETFYNSLLKNIGEFCEFVVDEFQITNYYDLVGLMIYLHNFRAETFKNNPTLANKITENL